MPRKSADAIATMAVSLTRSPRLKPPAWLDENVRAEFLAVVNHAPAAQFVATDAPLLARYAECLWLAKRALAAGEVDVWMKLAKLQASLAVKLRLAPSSRANTSRATSRSAGRALGISPDEFLQQMGDGDE